MDNMVKSDKVDDWRWIDAMQMAMPVFTRLGVLYNDTSYFRKCMNCMSYTKYKHGIMACISGSVCGGVIKILILLIRNLMAKIVTGAGEMAGWWLHL